ncbi:MAG: uroporphyrinogen decarboxylase family protein [Bacteroidales bacterium]
MNSKQRLQNSLNHKQPDRVVVDFGATPVTGIHVLAIERLREFYGLKKIKVKVTEPYQMLGEIGDDLAEVLGIDVKGVTPKNNMFGFENASWKEFRTFWGQEVLVPGNFNTSFDSDGDLLIYPEGDLAVAPSAKMPKASFFFDSIIRQHPLDENNLKVEDNLEEFELLSEENLEYWKSKAELVKTFDKGALVNFGGTALGDIALVPGPWMKNPKGIRDVSEWYMSTLLRMDYVREIFDKQSDIALENLKTLFGIFGNSIDVVFMCGTDFGTQDSQFCSPEIFGELYLPYYKKMNDWIHQNTSWKTFKHSCGAVYPLIPKFIEAGFDILNPVQINAADMDTVKMKKEFGKDIVFWGGGVDTQKVLSFGTPEEVESQVLRQCEILSKDGGFVFNTVHNTQANVPVANFVAMINAIKKFNS